MRGEWSETGHGLAVCLAFCLGALFGLGLSLAALSTNWNDLGLYMMILSLFHMWEYLYVALFHEQDLTCNSFLINHSKHYTAAALLSWVEYAVERKYFGCIKNNKWAIVVGLSVVIFGQAVRTLAMCTAGSNFYHRIRRRKERAHQLVTHGIYGFLRHPAYFGWFWWAIGTQVLLGNPLCVVAYAAAAWVFFDFRIRQEEATLVQFFGEEYVRYRQSTYIGIPFIA